MPAEASLEHVHGLGVDPTDGTVYAASHFGVFRIDEDGTATRIADRWQDTMAFTVTGPRTFLASGHPDLREDQPTHLGLIESTDAGESWTSLSLEGEADFHALEVAGRNVFGFDAMSGKLMVTADRRTWDEVSTTPVLDLAWLGEDEDAVLATTGRGVAEFQADGTAINLEGEPPLVLIDSPRRGDLVGVTANGQVYSSTDPTGGSWEPSGSRIPGAPQAFEASDKWYVATEEAIHWSSDRGRTWNELVKMR